MSSLFFNGVSGNVNAVTYKGNYDNYRKYKAQELVAFQGNTYISIKDSQGIDPNDESYWKVIARGSSSLQTNIKSSTPDLPTTGNYQIGDFIFVSNPTPSGILGWACCISGTACGNSWTPNGYYRVGDRIASSGNVYECTKAGFSNSGSGISGASPSIQDGTAQWTYLAPLAQFYSFGSIASDAASSKNIFTYAYPASGSYEVGQKVTLTANKPATIYFTLDGTTPTNSSNVYAEPITLTSTSNLKYFALDEHNNQTPISQENYTVIDLPPLPPSKLRILNKSATSINVGWNLSVSDDVLNYEISYSQNGTSFTVASSSLSNSTTSYNISGLTEDTTYTIRLVAIDNGNNRSDEALIVANTNQISAGEVTDHLILSLDFTNRTGTNITTINDSVNNIPCTITNVTFDNATDGYIDEKGIQLKPNGYVKVPSKTNATLKSLMSIAPNGLTFEITSYNTLGILYRLSNSTLVRSLISTIAQVNYDYISSSTGSPKNTFIQRNSWQTPTGQKSLSGMLSSTEFNTIAIRYNPNGTIDILINGCPEPSTSPIPADYSSLVESFINDDIGIRQDALAINGSNSTKIRYFKIYNKVLTNQEITQNYQSYVSNTSLQSVSVAPSVVNLAVGQTQKLSVTAIPAKFTTQLVNSFASSNPAFVTVDSSGLLTGISNGSATIEITSTNQTKTFKNYVIVEIGQSDPPPPASTRTVSGVAINRKTSTLTVGETFPVMATTLPFDVFDDNFVIWESSNTSVCTVNYGILEGKSQGTAVITAFDGTKTYSQSFTVSVSMPEVFTIPSQQIYNVVASEYGISLTNTDSTNTTNGIQSALNYASSNNYKKIVFPVGTYLVNPTVRTIKMPDNMVVDFQDSTINIELSAKTSTGYTMFFFDQISNTKLIRAKIYGESGSTTLSNSVESCLSIEVRDAINSGLENCTISKSPGFNIMTSLTLNKAGTSGTNIPKTHFEPGIIDSNGQPDNSVINNVFRSNNFLDISGLGSYYMLGYNQGYYGYAHLRSRLFSIYFYDTSKNFISSQLYNLQFYNYDKPANAKYAKIVIYQTVAPTTQDGDFNAVAFIRTVGMPRKCFIRNCIIEENFSTGLAMCGGEGWLIENNTFGKNGGRMPSCDIDWEDGWETMIGDVAKNNSFNSTTSIILSAGALTTIIDNTFNKSTPIYYGRTQNFKTVNNTFHGDQGRNMVFRCQAQSQLARNVIEKVTYSFAYQHEGAKYKIEDISNTLVP